MTCQTSASAAKKLQRVSEEYPCLQAHHTHLVTIRSIGSLSDIWRKRGEYPEILDQGLDKTVYSKIVNDLALGDLHTHHSDRIRCAPCYEANDWLSDLSAAYASISLFKLSTVKSESKPFSHAATANVGSEIALITDEIRYLQFLPHAGSKISAERIMSSLKGHNIDGKEEVMYSGTRKGLLSVNGLDNYSILCTTNDTSDYWDERAYSCRRAAAVNLIGQYHRLPDTERDIGNPFTDKAVTRDLVATILELLVYEQTNKRFPAALSTLA